MITRVIAIPERLLEGRGELFISLSFFFTYLRYTLLLLCDAVASLVEQFVATFFRILPFPSKLHEVRRKELHPPARSAAPKTLLADCSFTADTKTVI